MEEEWINRRSSRRAEKSEGREKNKSVLKKRKLVYSVFSFKFEILHFEKLFFLHFNKIFYA